MKKYRLKKEALGHPAGSEIIFADYHGKFSLITHGLPAIVFDKYEIENLIASGWIEEVPERVELVNLPDKGVCKTDCSGFTNDELSKMEAALNGELMTKREFIDLFVENKL